jgi:hypothetical protein
MKLSNTDLQNLHAVLVTCGIADIDGVQLDDGWARGANAEGSCLIISNQQVPKLGGNKAGIVYLSKLRQRLELFMTNGAFDDSVAVEAKASERVAEVAQLIITRGRDKLEWRCAPASMVKAPKGVNDEAAALLTVNRQQLKLLLDGLRLIDASRLVLAVRPDGTATFQIAGPSENLVITNDAPAELIGELDQSMVHYYLPKVLSSVLRAAGEEVTLAVGLQGTITVIVRGHTLILMPQVGAE